MSLDKQTQNEWQDCPPGEVKLLADRLQDRRQSIAAQRRMVAGVLVLMTFFTGYYFIGVLPHAEPNYGGIVCSRLHELAPQFMANTLDAETSARIREHLVHCESCQSLLGEMDTGSMTQAKPRTRDTNPPRRVSLEGFASLER